MYHRTIWFSAIHRNMAENVNLIFILYIIIYYNNIIYRNFSFLRVQIDFRNGTMVHWYIIKIVSILRFPYILTFEIILR